VAYWLEPGLWILIGSRSLSSLRQRYRRGLPGRHAEMDEHYPDKQIVGWYHTHPGMGVFLSSYDAWLHHHFFPEPWQVALVIDPLSPAGGFFIRQVDGTLDPGRYFGFHELDVNSAESFVGWNNLQQESPATENKGEELNE
jgi:hypothetical protein